MRNSKRIVFHTHEFNIKEGGPCTKRIDSFAQYLSENGYEVIILTGTHNKKNELENINRNYNVIYCPLLALGKKKTIYRLVEHITLAISSFLWGLFKLKKTDYIVTTSPPPLISLSGYLLAKIKKSKLIYDVRDIWPDVAVEMESFSEKSFYFKVFKFIANFMYKHSDYITTVSPGKVNKIKQYVKNKSKVIYIPNGLDDNFVNFDINEKLIKKYDLKNKDTIVYIGNVGLAQNLDAMVELAKKSIKRKKIQFLIFGEGAYKEKLISSIRELKLSNISVEGKINYSDVYTILKYSKISFISLKNKNMKDSVPTKIFDAMGAGCPILLLANGDSCNILDEIGFGEHCDDDNNLLDKFNYMLDNYKKYDLIREKSVEFVKNNYSRRMIAKKLESDILKK